MTLRDDPLAPSRPSGSVRGGAGPDRALGPASHTGPGARRAGFTLFEVLVVVAILAVLSAVLFPMIVSRIEEGEPVRLSSDVQNIKTGIQSFQLDVRGDIIPGDLEDLTQPIDSLDAGIFGELYSPSEQDDWDGPYLDFQFPRMDTAFSDTTHLTTGFGGRVHTKLLLFDESEDPAIHTDLNADGDTVAVDAPISQLERGRDWAAISILGLDEVDFEIANDQIDGEAEGDGDFDGQSQWEGRLRFDDGLRVTFYLVVPIKRIP